MSVSHVYIFWNGRSMIRRVKKIKCYENQKIFPFFIKSLHREQRFLIFFSPQINTFSPKKIFDKFKNPLKKERRQLYHSYHFNNDHLHESHHNDCSTIDSKPIHRLVTSSLEQDWGEDRSKSIDRYFDSNPDDQSWTNVFI